MTATIAAVETAFQTRTRLVQLFVKVTASDGEYGLGEAWWGVPPGPSDDSLRGHMMPIASVVEDLLKPRLLGRPAAAIEAIRLDLIEFAYRYGIEGVISSAMSGVDTALWDLKGKDLGVPVIDLLGGQVHDTLRAYASLPPLRDPEVLAREVRRAVAHGFTGIKLHEVDPELGGLARDEAGPEIALMFDVNGHFTPAQARPVARRLADFGYTWFEEPVFPMRDHAAMAALRQSTGMAVAAGENEFNLAGLEALMTSAAADIVMPEVAKIGGLSVMKQVSTIAERHNRTVSPHGFRVGPALYANVHWALNTANADWIEIPFLPEGLEVASATPIPPVTDGHVSLPAGAGLGLPEGS